MIELYEEGVTVAAALPHLGDEGAYGVPATQGPVERAVLRMLRNGHPSEGSEKRSASVSVEQG